MKTDNTSTTILEGYVRLLDNLNPDSKLDLISRLTLSVKTDITDKKRTFYKAFGAWNTKQSADQIIDSIRASRTFNRKTEKL